MGRVSAILLAAVVACALGVVTSQHRARSLFSALESEQAAAKKLDEEWTQLQLEQGTWANNKRVADVAARRLGMRMPQPDTTIIVDEDGRAVGARP